MQQHIGFPEYLHDEEKLNEEYVHVSSLVPNLIMFIYL